MKPTGYCALHGQVEIVNDEGIERCPICEHATSTTMDEAIAFLIADLTQGSEVK